MSSALSHAGLSESQVSRIKIELEQDDGRAEYEVDFIYNGFEYEYTIDTSSAAVLEHEKDRDD